MTPIQIGVALLVLALALLGVVLAASKEVLACLPNVELV